MIAKSLANLCLAGGATGAMMVAIALCAELPGDAANKPGDGGQAAAAEPANVEHRISVPAARERAKVMHRIYAATLDVMHEHYFHSNRAVVPARAMEDVFEEMAGQLKVEARWISVNTQAMSVSHEPQNEFEKAAAKEIAAGKDEYELVENGYYRRAGAIPLATGCVNCHAGFFKTPPKTPRFAGLVISVPVNEE